MFSRKPLIIMALLVLCTSLVLPTRSVVNLAGLDLFGSSASPHTGAYRIGDTSMTNVLVNGSSIDDLLANTSMLNNPLINNSTMNNSLLNASLINVSSKDTSSINVEPAGSSKTDMVRVDLSGYASGRLNKNLTGYKNILYPMSGSRGFSSSAAGGGGGCCGGG